MAIDHYILDAKGNPVPEPRFGEWCAWFETADRQVAYDQLNGLKVSTVFLGLDHSFGRGGGGQPVLWESMIFGGLLDQTQLRCAGTREQAEAMHADMLNVARADYSRAGWFMACTRKRRRKMKRQLNKKIYEP